jgi:hypothetical protein
MRKPGNQERTYFGEFLVSQRSPDAFATNIDSAGELLGDRY